MLFRRNGFQKSATIWVSSSSLVKMEGREGHIARGREVKALSR